MHGGSFDKGEHCWGGRDEVVDHAPVPGNELEGIGDAREEYEADGEEGNEEHGGLGVGEPAREGEPQKGGGKDIGDEQRRKGGP